MELDDEDDEFMMAFVASSAVQLVVFEDDEEIGSDDEDDCVDHRTLPRSARRKFDHNRAFHCIMQDWLGPGCLFFDKEFIENFTISRGRFESIAQKLARWDTKFYSDNLSANKEPVASVQAKILIALKSISYGVPPSSYCDYFQMSRTLSDTCRTMLLKGMVACFKEDYLRVMTPADARSVSELHRAVHDVDGIGGSLDCMHYNWTKCPKAWQGTYKRGDQKYPSLVLEAACDYNLYIWHACFGFPGTFNDLNVLALSPLYNAFIDGTFDALNVNAEIGGEDFDILAFLVDGIYPPYAQFIQGLSCPSSTILKYFTEWQESVRKDIERCFGVLQLVCRVLAVPIAIHNLDTIGKLVETCLIIHNMRVEERVMGTHAARYVPSHGINMEPLIPSGLRREIPSETERQKAARLAYEASQIGVGNLDEPGRKLIVDMWKKGYDKTKDVGEHRRLRDAVAREVYSNRKKKRPRPQHNV